MKCGERRVWCSSRREGMKRTLGCARMASMPDDGWAAGARCVRIAIDAPKLITTCEPTNGNHAYAHAMECHARAALFGDEQAAVPVVRAAWRRATHTELEKRWARVVLPMMIIAQRTNLQHVPYGIVHPMNDLAASTSTAVPHLIDRRMMLQVHNHYEVPVCPPTM